MPIEKTQNVVQSRPNQYAQYHYLSENSVGRKKVEQSHNLSALWTKIRFFNGSIHFWFQMRCNICKKWLCCINMARNKMISLVTGKKQLLRIPAEKLIEIFRILLTNTVSLFWFHRIFFYNSHGLDLLFDFLLYATEKGNDFDISTKF